MCVCVCERERERVCFVGCLVSQQYASVSQRQICPENFTCCHSDIQWDPLIRKLSGPDFRFYFMWAFLYIRAPEHYFECAFL